MPPFGTNIAMPGFSAKYCSRSLRYNVYGTFLRLGVYGKCRDIVANLDICRDALTSRASEGSVTSVVDMSIK